MTQKQETKFEPSSSECGPCGLDQLLSGLWPNYTDHAKPGERYSIM